jgi:hypothetical protein
MSLRNIAKGKYPTMNKLSLVGMQLPEKYKKSDEGPSLEMSKFSLYFQVVASLPTKACSYYWHYLYTGIYRQFKDIRLSISAARRVSSSHLWTASRMFKGSLERNNFFDIVQVNKFSNFLENFLHAQDFNWQAMFSRQWSLISLNIQN